MDNQLFRDIQTDLDLNGPILSFTTQPVDTTINVGQTATFTAVATVSFPGDPTPINSGTIGYQWYGPLGVLTEGTKYVGTKTTTLQITNVTSPTDVGAYYAVVDYVPSTQTGNATNEPFRSDSGNLIAPPLLEIVAQPTSVTTLESENRNFNIDAQLSDNGTDVGYQWQLDGNNITDGTVTKSTVELIPGTTEKRVRWGASLGNQQIVGIPVGAKNVTFEVAGSAGGRGGGNFVNPAGPDRVGGRGGNGMTGWFNLHDSYYIDNIPWKGLKSTVQVTLSSGRKGDDGMVGSLSPADGGQSTHPLLRGGNGGKHGIGYGGVGANNIPNSSGDAAGGGGGGGSAMIMVNGQHAIVAGGGGGGGGAFNNTAQGANSTGSGQNGFDAGPVRTSSGPNNWEPSVLNWATGTVSPQNGDNGSSGHDGQGIDTPGGGGGGAGDPRGWGGHHGHRPNGSPGGRQGGSKYNPSIVNYRSGSSNAGDGWAFVHYTVDDSETMVPTNVTRTTTISGSSTNQLTLNTDGPGIGYTVRCNVNSSIASNSPVISDEVDYQVLSSLSTANIVVEGIGLNPAPGIDNTLANVSTINLNNGELTLDTVGNNFSGPAPTIQLYSLHAPDSDVDVEMDLYGGGGDSGTPEGDSGGNDGGEGGFGRIRFTMKQNEEYVIAGLTDIINTPFLYRKSALIACVGEGGKSSSHTGAKGGDGGGIGIAGADATGTPERRVPGGNTEPAGALGINGQWGTAYNPGLIWHGDSGWNTAGLLAHQGGTTIKCTKGIYWRQQGLSACSDIPGDTRFRLSDGTTVINTASIQRGYKAGYNLIQTAGGKGIRGGNGMSGGYGGANAGGGGSGYTDGSVTVVSTTQGGSREAAKVVIRVAT